MGISINEDAATSANRRRIEGVGDVRHHIPDHDKRLPGTGQPAGTSFAVRSRMPVVGLVRLQRALRRLTIFDSTHSASCEAARDWATRKRDSG